MNSSFWYIITKSELCIFFNFELSVWYTQNIGPKFFGRNSITSFLNIFRFFDQGFLELEKPERVQKIKEDHEIRRKRELSKRKVNPLDPDEYLDDDELFGQGKYCLACHK